MTQSGFLQTWTSSIFSSSGSSDKKPLLTHPFRSRLHRKGKGRKEKRDILFLNSEFIVSGLASRLPPMTGLRACPGLGAWSTKPGRVASKLGQADHCHSGFPCGFASWLCHLVSLGLHLFDFIISNERTRKEPPPRVAVRVEGDGAWKTPCNTLVSRIVSPSRC